MTLVEPKHEKIEHGTKVVDIADQLVSAVDALPDMVFDENGDLTEETVSVRKLAFNPSEPRAADGKWTSGFPGAGAAKKIAKPKKAPEHGIHPKPARKRKTAADALAEIKARVAKKQQAKEARQAAAKANAKPDAQKIAKAKETLKKHAAAVSKAEKPAHVPAPIAAPAHVAPAPAPQENQVTKPSAEAKAAAKQKLQEAKAAAMKQKADAAKQKHEEKIKKLAERMKEHQAKAAAKAEAKKQKQDAKERAAHEKAQAKQAAVEAKAKKLAEAKQKLQAAAAAKASKSTDAAKLKAVHEEGSSAIASGSPTQVAAALKKANATKPPAGAKATTKVAHASVTAALEHVHAKSSEVSSGKFKLAGTASIDVGQVKKLKKAINPGLDFEIARKRGLKNVILKKLAPADAKGAELWSEKWQRVSTDASAAEALHGVQQGTGWANAQYHTTQALIASDIESMKASGIIDADGYVTLYRGVKGRFAQKLLKASSKGGGRTKLTARAASSWSTDPIVAKKFATKGAVAKTKIHYSRAFAVHKYEDQLSNWKSEHEWVMLSEHGGFDVEVEKQ